MIKKIILSFFIGVFGTACSQNVDKKKLDDYFSALDRNQKVMGSFAIAKDDQIVYTNAIGFADVENKIKADDKTVYRIGSISKTFTAVLVMKAAEEGKLKLENKLSQYFPQIKNSEKITIENLLQHRSGIHSFTDDPDYFSYNTQYISQPDLLAKIVKGGSDFEPDSKYTYSNSNYVILAMILENIYKKSYSQILSEKITKPLGLTSTKVGEKINSKSNVANSYVLLDKKYNKSEETDMSVPIGAGNVVSTPSGLLKFIIALANGKIVSKASLEKMQQYKENYGLGIFPVPFNNQKGFGHNGSIDDYRSVLYYFPESKTAFAMITNQSDYDNNQISITALKAANGIDFEVPDFKMIQVSALDLKKLEGLYATASIPLKINIFTENGQLKGQATGQSAFPLEAVSNNTFKFDAAAIKMVFNPEKKEMIFTQGGSTFTFTKE
ncbi:beta-lactamase family protein [Kaistella sp. G5-32]|uniref:Beta-lactamase family protein n=2 Tax=Kaistella gelatinilytica TaxID=2787636 RepID=A0ABS0FB81_9FLAO|nr:beta-lactamase family protein [Kaistella gelatinilytica]